MSIKNIVICSDGTGNTANKARGTNVFKIFESVDIYGHTIDPTLTPQVTIYDDGVGTSNFKPIKLAGGAFGWGLGRNVRQLYAELARVYLPGDRIYLFGFSRGAFTVRTLAQLITTCGIIDRYKCRNDICLNAHVAEAYSEYRQRYRTVQGQRFRKPLDPQRAADFRKRASVIHETHAPEGKVTIEFIGVWDTVDAVGVPVAYLGNLINNYIYPYKFPEARLSPQVKKACHALSIDDERLTFHPEIWDEAGEPEGRIEQVWFPGVHSNVGGGYPKQGLSLVTLYWMMKKAEAAGLRFSECDITFVRDRQHPFDKLYDSRGGLAVYYRYSPRNMERMCRENSMVPKIHISALDRIVQGTEGYAPGNIAANAQIVTTEPQPINLDAVSAAVQLGLAPDRILLDRARSCIGIRKGCHIALITITLVFFALLVSLPKGREALGALLSGSFVNFGETLAELPPSVQGSLLILLMAGVVLLAVTFVVRRRMTWLFSDAWYAISSALSAALHKRDLRLVPGNTAEVAKAAKVAKVAKVAELAEVAEVAEVAVASVNTRKLCENCDIPPVRRFLACMGMGRLDR